MAPYRNDLEALEARHAALEAEVAERVRARDEAARMLAEARARGDEARGMWRAGVRRDGERRRRVLAMLVPMAIGLTVVVFTILGMARMGERQERAARTAALVAQLEAFTDETCACQDIACASRVTDAMVAWANTLARESAADAPPEPWVQKQITELGQRLGACMSALAQARGGGGGGGGAAR